MKNKLLLITFFILSFPCHDLFAQYKKHQIIDSISKQPVSYANLKNGDFNFSADSLGYFLVADKDALLTITCIGYQTKNIKTAYSNALITLSPVVYTLNEVLVNPIDYRFVQTNFVKDFFKKFEERPYDVDFFYREFTKLKGKYIDFNEGFGLYHFEGFTWSSCTNKHSTRAILKIDEIRSLNTMMNKKNGFHAINWLAAANNINHYIPAFLISFGDDYTNRGLKNLYEDKDETIAEVSFEPNELKMLLRRQSTYFNTIYGSVLASSGSFFANAKTGKLYRVVFDVKDFKDSYSTYNKSDLKFKMVSLRGEINYIEDINNKTVPSFLACDIKYFLKENPSEIIEKHLEFYFSKYDFANQTNEALSKKYNAEIKYEFPLRAITYSPSKIFVGKAEYHQEFWDKRLPYPPYFDIKKVESDLKSQGINIYQKFKEFNNTY